IRTPMNGILGITKLLFETNLSDDQRYFSSLIRNSGDALLVVINDILDFSKIEAGKLDLEIIDFNLRSTLNDITDIMALKAEQKKLEFICFVDPKVPSLLRGDPGRLRQVILNLIGNAFKFTPHGEVVVNVNLEKESDDEAVIRFTVSDTGIGIKKDQLNALFDAFTQADLSTTRKYGGTGLGLTISKELVEKMGSHLQVESSDGEGATFFFTVPFKKQAHITEPEAEERLQINGEKILVVDDNETNRKLLEKILLAWGFNVDEACDGFSALEKLHSAAAGNDPFVIAILDMQMPEMDGESLGKKIKETISLSKTILIMMTSMGKRGDSSRLEEIGFSVYLHKPVIESRLFNCLMEVLKRDVGLEKPEHSIITKYSITEIIQQNSKLLLVEDNETNRVVALKLLEKLGYNADVAGNGKEALDALANKKYDLVLMDCQMPVMDGYEATREIRAREKKEYEQMDQNVPIAHIPILAMTADAMEGAQKKCIEAGMDDYISKPVKDSQLQKAITKWLPDSKKPLPAHSNAPSLYKDDNETVFSKTDLLKRFMGDVEFAENILTVFLSDIEKQFTAMRKEVNNQNFAQIKNHAHTIKGAASNISCLSLAAASAKVERAAADKECQLTLSLFSDMELQFKKLKSEMKKTDFHS
ncbi:MAG: response regulator, partial [bacterium]|nr:response regulator [bacterium]